MRRASGKTRRNSWRSCSVYSEVKRPAQRITMASAAEVVCRRRRWIGTGEDDTGNSAKLAASVAPNSRFGTAMRILNDNSCQSAMTDSVIRDVGREAQLAAQARTAQTD